MTKNEDEISTYDWAASDPSQPPEPMPYLVSRDQQVLGCVREEDDAERIVWALKIWEQLATAQNFSAMLETILILVRKTKKNLFERP